MSTRVSVRTQITNLILLILIILILLILIILGLLPCRLSPGGDVFSA